MDYLGSAVTFLQQQNSELKAKLKKLHELNDLLMKEMTSTSNFMAHDETDILKLHHATIESGLQRELGKMTVEVHELQAELTSTSDALIAERKQVQTYKSKSIELAETLQIAQLKIAEIQAEQQRSKAVLQAAKSQEQGQLASVYQLCKQQITSNHESKMTKLIETYQHQLEEKQREISELTLKLQRNEQQMSLLQERLQIYSQASKQQESKRMSKFKQLQIQIKNSQAALATAKSINQDLQDKVLKLTNLLDEETQNSNGLRLTLRQLSAKFKEMEKETQREYLKEKSKSIKAMQSIAEQQKYFDHQIRHSKKKQLNLSVRNKSLLLKLKQLDEFKQSNYEGTRQTNKSSRKSIDTYQTISLENSLLGDCPQISIAKPTRQTRSTALCVNSQQNQKRPRLRLQSTQQWIPQLIRDVDTPSFESSNLKKTIKIKK